jgi:hypothetical protein
MAECKLKCRSCSHPNEQNADADKPERNLQKRGMRFRSGRLVLCEGKGRGRGASLEAVTAPSSNLLPFPIFRVCIALCVYGVFE